MALASLRAQAQAVALGESHRLYVTGAERVRTSFAANTELRSVHTGELVCNYTVNFASETAKAKAVKAWEKVTLLPRTDVERVLYRIYEALAAEFEEEAAKASQPLTEGERWREALLCVGNTRTPKDCASNYGLFFTHHAMWKGKLWWDAVAELPMCEGEPIADGMADTIARYLGVHEKMAVTNMGLLTRQLIATCKATPRDPIQEWLCALPAWDEVPRLDTFLIRVGNAADTPANRFISRMIPIGMVSRALHPGSMYRYVPILEGPEDIGKSKLVRMLGAPWSHSLSPKIHDKEAYMQLKGVWLAEFAELEALSKAEEARIKAFISDVVDYYVPKYENSPTAQMRRTVFIGTINEQEYLKGTTGDTRFFPITLKPPLNFQYLEEWREQLFAEALHVLKQHENAPWWELSPEVQEELGETRRERHVQNPYTDDLYTWLAKHGGGATEITWEVIAKDYLGLPRHDWKDVVLQRSIAAAFRELGWENKVVRPLQADGGGKSYKAHVSPAHRVHSKHATCDTCKSNAKVIKTGTGHTCLVCNTSWHCDSCMEPQDHAGARVWRNDDPTTHERTAHTRVADYDERGLAVGGLDGVVLGEDV